MGSLSHPGPPGTINDAKLSSEAFGAAATPTTSHSEAGSIPSATAAVGPKIARPAVPLPRISSDWDPDHDIVVRRTSRHQDVRKEFESCRGIERRPAAAGRARHTSHLGHFRSQTGSGENIHVPVDPHAGPDATVVVDRATASIYDVYLLRVDVTRNVNRFRRHQVVFNPKTKTYTLLTREGHVGLQGACIQEFESADLKKVASKFRKSFRTETDLKWRQRYNSLFSSNYNFAFVELDYRRAAATTPKDLPNYAMTDVKVNEELKDLMELILYGGLMCKGNVGEDPEMSGSWSAFSAPYGQLSPWTIYSAFKTLECIWKHLESGRPIHWKAILRASSRYRSQIPFCGGKHNRLPVISSYHTIFLELKFLHSLWPQQEIENMLTEIHRLASLQLNTYNALAHPLYQAYSSLRHGFRRLTDTSTLEFRELKSYLETSCHRTHHLSLELQDIYRVFIKSNLPNPYADWLNSKEAIFDFCGEERLLLWHGTPLNSLLGILDLGLQVRRQGANLNGAMFGNGIYLTDVSSKSANYCDRHLCHGEAVLLLCEADVGKSRFQAMRSMHNGHVTIENSVGLTRCIEGVGKVRPASWKRVGWEMGGLPCPSQGRVLMPDPSVPYSGTSDNQLGNLRFNEYVVYDPSHVFIRYLFRLKIKNQLMLW